MTQRMTITGIEISEGTSKKNNRAYSIGTVHTATQLAPPMGEGNVAKGLAGDKYECDPVILRRIEHLSFPLNVDAEVSSQIRFGQRQQVITDIRPVELVKKAA